MTILTHGIILGEEDLLNPYAPRIGYENLFRIGTSSVSSEATDRPKELAYDGLTYDGWRSTGNVSEWFKTHVSPAAEADYFAVAAHTLAGAQIKPQYSTDGVAWTDLAAAFIPADNRPIVWEFDTVVAPHYRLLIEFAPDVVTIGAIHVGKKFQMPIGVPKGWEPPSLNEETDYSNTMSHGGQILGRTVIRKTANVEVITEPVEYVWTRQDWLDFVAVADEYAVFFWWSFNGFTEIVYGGLESKEAKFWSSELLSVKIQLKGINR